MKRAMNPFLFMTIIVIVGTYAVSTLLDQYTELGQGASAAIGLGVALIILFMARRVKDKFEDE